MMSFWPPWAEVVSVAVATKRLTYKMAALFFQLCSTFSVPLLLSQKLFPLLRPSATSNFTSTSSNFYDNSLDTTKMVNFTILAGGFSTFIATYVFNNDTSTLTIIDQTTTGENPSWIASHPNNASVL